MNKIRNYVLSGYGYMSVGVERDSGYKNIPSPSFSAQKPHPNPRLEQKLHDLKQNHQSAYTGQACRQLAAYYDKFAARDVGMAIAAGVGAIGVIGIGVSASLLPVTFGGSVAGMVLGGVNIALAAGMARNEQKRLHRFLGDNRKVYDYDNKLQNGVIRYDQVVEDVDIIEGTIDAVHEQSLRLVQFKLDSLITDILKNRKDKSAAQCIELLEKMLRKGRKGFFHGTTLSLEDIKIMNEVYRDHKERYDHVFKVPTDQAFKALRSIHENPEETGLQATLRDLGFYGKFQEFTEKLMGIYPNHHESLKDYCKDYIMRMHDNPYLENMFYKQATKLLIKTGKNEAKALRFGYVQKLLHED